MKKALRKQKLVMVTNTLKLVLDTQNVINSLIN